MKYHTCTRLLSLVLAVVMMLSLLSVAAFAVGAPDYAHLEIGTATGAPGDTVKIPVYLKGLKEGQKCRGFDTTVVLGENLTPVGAEWTDLVSGFGYKIFNKDSGYLTATDIMNGGFRITADGKLCDLLVKIADDATSVGAVSLTKVSISGDTAVDFLNSTDGKMSGRDLNAVVAPTDEAGNPVPIISVKQAATFTMKVEADKASVTADEDVTVTVKVEGGSFVGAAAKLGYNSDLFTVKTTPETGWDPITGGYSYYNVAGKDSTLDPTLGTFVFTAKAQAEEVTGSFTLSDTYCEETWDSGASADVATPCANNGKVDVTITLKDDLDVTAENKTVTYDGNAHAFNEVTTTVAGATIAYGETEGTYDLTTVPSKTDVGTYTLYYKVTAPGYVPKTGSYTLTINPAAIEYTATDYIGTYDGAKHTISVTVTNPADAVITYSDEENGTYTDKPTEYSAAPTNATVWFKISAGSNYVDVTDKRTVKIDEADIVVDITANERVTYDGQPHVSATINRLIPSYANIDYMWGLTQVGAGSNTPPSFTDAGEYKIDWTASRAGYKVTTGSYTFIIDKANIADGSYTITANADVNYDGAAHVSATANIPEGMSVTYTCNGQTYTEVPSFTEIGEYEVSYTVSAGNNYNAATGSYTFKIKDGTIEASSTGYHGTYDGNPHSITVTVTRPEGTTIQYRTNEEAEWSNENPTFTNAGDYTVYWQVTKTGYTAASGHDTVQIDKADITGYSVTANPDATYDGEAHESATVTLPAGASITYTCNEVTYNTVPSFTNVGTYTVSYTISAGDNYNDVTGSYTFIIKEGTLTVTGTDYTGEYDGNAHTITVAAPEGAAISYSETENSEYIAAAPTQTDVGPAKTVYWKVEKPGYTTVTGHNTITITKKAVTIKIEAASKFIGDADPAFTATVTGLVNDNDLGEITYTRAAGETAGTYEITANYTLNPNYDVTVTTNILTISAPDYFVETVGDYVTGYSLVLVYTDSNATFTYNSAAMYDVTSAGYEHPEHVGTKYAHVYALVVKGEASDTMVAAGMTPVVETLNCGDLDVNKSGSVDLRDAVAVVAVYNANETYMKNYMAIVLEADVNHSKHVDVDDFGLIKAEYLK